MDFTPILFTHAKPPRTGGGRRITIPKVHSVALEAPEDAAVDCGISSGCRQSFLEQSLGMMEDFFFHTQSPCHKASLIRNYSDTCSKSQQRHARISPILTPLHVFAPRQEAIFKIQSITPPLDQRIHLVLHPVCRCGHPDTSGKLLQGWHYQNAEAHYHLQYSVPALDELVIVRASAFVYPQLFHSMRDPNGFTSFSSPSLYAHKQGTLAKKVRLTHDHPARLHGRGGIQTHIC